MSSVEVNGRVQDLTESEKQNKVVPGCGDAEQHDQGAIRPLQATRAPEEAKAAPKAQRARGTVGHYSQNNFMFHGRMCI